LSLLSDPEDAVGHNAHQENDEAWREHDQRAPEAALGVDGFGGRDAEIEHQERHGYGEDSVAEGGKALDALSGNAVVEGRHRTEFSGLMGRGQSLRSDGERGR